MTRARQLSRLTSPSAVSVDSGTYNVGIGSTTPDVKLDVIGSIEASGISTFQNNLFVGAGITMLASSGIVSAVSFYGDGSALTGIDATSLKDDGGNIKVQANPSGAVVTGVLTATSFEGDGTSLTGVTPFNWSTKTSNYTAVHKDGLFVDTSAGIVTVTLPASPSAGDYVHFIDLDGTFATNNLIVDRNGSNIIGVASNLTVDINNSGLTLVYTDATNGWKLLNF